MQRGAICMTDSDEQHVQTLRGSFKSVTTLTRDGISAVQRNGKPNDGHESCSFAESVARTAQMLNR